MYYRKTAPGVKNGRVQKKNNHQFTVWENCIITRDTPKRGYRHLISQKDVKDFLSVFPDWHRYGHGIERIQLTSGSEGYYGCYYHHWREGTGSIEIPAWEKDIWTEYDYGFYKEHQNIFETLKVTVSRKDDSVKCHFNIKQARAFTLVHVLTHEIGHHYDKMTGINSQFCSRGEDFAEQFSMDLFPIIYPAYVDIFGLPSIES